MDQTSFHNTLSWAGYYFNIAAQSNEGNRSSKSSCVTQDNRNKLILRWQQTESLKNASSVEQARGNTAEFAEFIGSESDHEDIFTGDVKVKPSCTTSFEYELPSTFQREDQEVRVVTCGKSFDSECFQTVPVCLIMIERKQSASKPKSPNFMIFKVKKCVSNLDAKRTEFELILLKTFSITGISSTIVNGQNVAFGSNFLIIIIDPVNSVVKLCNPGNDSRSTTVSDFMLPEFSGNCLSREATLLEVAVLPCIRKFILFLRTQDTVISLFFQPETNFNPDNIVSDNCESIHYKMVNIKLETFLAPHYISIMEAFSLSAVAEVSDFCHKRDSFSSVITILTKTGFLLRFVNRILEACVNVSEHLEPPTEEQEQMFEKKEEKMNSCKIINFVSKTAALIRGTCYLCDWAQEKIVKSWPSVTSIQSSESLTTGSCNLVLIFSKENRNSSHSHIFETCVHTKASLYGALRGDDPDAAMSDEEMSKSQPPSDPLACAKTALQAQEKKCEEAVKELEDALRRKLSFISKMWDELSQTQTCNTNTIPLKSQLSYQHPLVSLVEGNLPSKELHGMQDKITQGLTGDVDAQLKWTRIIDSFVVVGLQVANTSERAIENLSAWLQPSQCGITPVTNCASRVAQIWQSPHQDWISLEAASVTEMGAVCANRPLKKKTRVSEELIGQGNSENGRCLQPGQIAVVTCKVKLSEVFGSRDVKLWAFLQYEIVTKLGMKDTSSSCKVVCCGDVNISNSQILSGELDIAKHGELSHEDVLALDSVQTKKNLTVHSIVSSVKTLVQNLRTNSSVKAAEGSNQFVVMNESPLRHCRMQMLSAVSRHKVQIEVFTKSDFQTLLFIKFLYTLVPEDISITPQTNQEAVNQTSLLRDALLKEVETEIAKTKIALDLYTVEEKRKGEKTERQVEVGGSPKFNSGKFGRLKAKRTNVRKTIDVRQGASTSS